MIFLSVWLIVEICWLSVYVMAFWPMASWLQIETACGVMG
jgi:hypothetical protein